MKTLLLILSILYSITLFAQPAGYGFGKLITIQHSQVSGSSFLLNFPVLVSFTDNDLRTTGNGGNVENANGYDIIFTLGDCSTQLDHQIEKYDAVTGEYIAWVRVHGVSNSANTNIHMYYGNSSVSADPSTNSTWDANYQGVWHLHDDFNDGTTTGNNLTNNGSTDVAGKIGDGQDFDGTNDNIIHAGPTIPTGNTSYTIEAWFNTDAFGSGGIVGWGAYGTNNRVNALRIFNGSGGLHNYWWNNDISYTGAGVSLNTWHHVAVNYDGTTRRIYLDGTQVQSDTPGSSLNTNNSNFRIGQTCPVGCAGTEYFDGTIDEVRISNIARSADWIATEYNNQNNPSAFYTVSAQMTPAALCASTLPIELVKFDAYQHTDQIKLDWQTASETNNDYFTVERSKNSFDWEKVIDIDSKHGNSSSLLSYSAIDETPYSDVSYYRLKQTDYDGQFAYSQVVSVAIKPLENSEIEVFPNPTEGQITIIGRPDELGQVKIYNTLGQDVTASTRRISKSESTLVIDLSKLSVGLYYIKTKTTANNKIYRIL